MSTPPHITRRPLKSRETKWAAAVARGIAAAGIPPNAISVAGAGFAGLAGVCLWLAGQRRVDCLWSGLLVLAVVGIQLRLLCNLFDGMVAIEGGLKTKAGELFNELPDRFSDAFILIGAGYSVSQPGWVPVLGWAAATLSVITAYVRALGASMGAGQHFIGPMAKQQRMAVMTTGCLAAAFAPVWPPMVQIIPAALGMLVTGCLVTILRRCRRIAQVMESK
ncbi:MAG: CDP-alcohol phosphatidyltransferase family protein [Verrucomicrobiota bacterium]